MKRILILALIPVILSCTRSDRCGCFDSTGQTETESRNTGAFYELEVDHVFDVYLHLNTSCHVDIKAGKHLLKGIKTEITNGRLCLKNHNKCNWVRRYNGNIRADVYCDSITYIRLWESCNLTCTDTIIRNEFKIDNYAGISNVSLTFLCNTFVFALHAGTGLMQIHGYGGVSYLLNNGYGSFDFRDFRSDYCYITSNSTGNSFITVNHELGATLKNSGNIYYFGNPPFVSTTALGKGKLIKGD
jgi:hypothetical protein